MSGIISTKHVPTGHKNLTEKQHTMRDGTVVTERSHDVTQIIESNKFLQGEQDMHHQSEVFNHVANIDMLAIEGWCKTRGMGAGYWSEFMSSETLLREFLNDPDNKLWRTRLGKI